MAVNQAGSTIEYKVLINNVPYTMDSLVSLNSSCDVFDSGQPTVGGCRSAQMKVSIFLSDTTTPLNELVPKKSECKVLYRNADDDESEWIPKGTFYINKRSLNKSGLLSLETLDAMDKANPLMYTTEGQVDQWPKTDIEVVDYICDVLGVDLDEDTEDILVNEYEVQYPGFGDGGFTIRQVLGYIGAMYGGNWIISGTNKLKLLRLCDFPCTAAQVTHDIGDDFAEDFNELLQYPTITRVTIDVGTDEETGDPIYYTSGTNDGAELEFECPWGTQAMADTLLDELDGFVYRPYELTNVVIDPSFELWDGIECSGIYTGITSYTRYFDPLFTADISATGEQEMDDEYPYVTQDELKQKQTNAKTTASLIVQSNRILAEVRRATEQEEVTESNVTDVRAAINAEIEERLAAVNALDTRIATLELDETALTLGFTVAQKSLKADLYDGDTLLSTANADFDYASYDEAAGLAGDAEANAKGYTDGEIAPVREVVEEVTTYFSFSNVGLIIGKTNSDSSILLSNTELDFRTRNNDGTINKVAWMSGDMLYAHNARFVGEVGFKSESYTGGYYAFIPQSNGHLTLKWIG